MHSDKLRVDAHTNADWPYFDRQVGVVDQRIGAGRGAADLPIVVKILHAWGFRSRRRSRGGARSILHAEKSI